MSSCNRRTASPGPGAQGAVAVEPGEDVEPLGSLLVLAGGSVKLHIGGGRRAKASSFQPIWSGSRRASATLRAISTGSVGFLRRRGILDFLISMMKGFPGFSKGACMRLVPGLGPSGLPLACIGEVPNTLGEGFPG